jgi:hypothetical protein
MNLYYILEYLFCFISFDSNVFILFVLEYYQNFILEYLLALTAMDLCSLKQNTPTVRYLS